MTMLDREIAEFGRRMGMPGFTLAGGDMAALDIESLGRVYFERGEGELLIYLAFPVPAHDAKAPRRVLELCGYGHAHPMPLCGGVHAGNAVLLTRMDERSVTAAMLENAIAFLGKMQERIA